MAGTAATNDHIAKIFSDKAQITAVAFHSRISEYSNLDWSGVDSKIDAFILSHKWAILKKKIAMLQKNDLFSGINLHGLEHSIKKILKNVYNLRPDAVAIQVTSDESIQFSFRCDKITHYLEYFPGNVKIGAAEYILNSYKDKKPLTDSYAGNLDKIFIEINEKIFQINRFEIKKIQDAVMGQPIFDMKVDSTDSKLIFF